jgi:hypothetical protein
MPIGWLRDNIDEVRRRRAIERRWAREDGRFRQAVADGRAVAGVQRDVYAHFRSAAPELNDFDEVRDGLFTRPLHPEIRAVLKVAALKGASYTLCWGVSLAFVPHVTSTGTSLHRTAKSSRLDLWVDAHIAFDDDRSGAGRNGRVAHWAGGDGIVWWVPEDFEALWNTCREPAYAWWERVQSRRARDYSWTESSGSGICRCPTPRSSDTAPNGSAKRWSESRRLAPIVTECRRARMGVENKAVPVHQARRQDRPDQARFGS